MELADFDYDLPPERIAHEPARPREAARLLRVTAGGLADRHVRDLPDLLRPNDILVVNDTQVIPAQLTAMRGAARIGITLDRPLTDGSWRCLARNARRLRAGDVLDFGEGLEAAVVRREDDGTVTLRFQQEGEAFHARLARAGALALPPYIHRPHGPTPEDQSRYQTMFARHAGAVAAPTAGLHFTPALLERLSQRGIGMARVTLHVGAGTFLPVRDDIAGHTMHSERGIVPAEAVAAIAAARAKGGRVIAVGTTSLRALETAAAGGTLQAWQGDTDLFILPGYRFQVADLLLTNFHLPRSTLFMLVCAFAGHERMRQAYAHAIETEYRFYSFGDATLLDRA